MARLTGDFHVHSWFSADARGEPAQHLRAARQRGLDMVGLSEHADFDPADPGYGFLRAGAYRQAVAGLAGVACGVEVDWQPRFAREIRAFLADHDFDYAIGSVHFVDGLPLYAERTLRGSDRRALLAGYVEAHLALIDSGLFRVVGHLDFPKRYAPQALLAGWPTDHLDPILAAVAASGLLLEVNTGGLRRPLGEPSPSFAVLERFRALGGVRVVLGSDAHRPEDVGAGFDVVQARLDRLGLRACSPLSTHE